MMNKNDFVETIKNGILNYLPEQISNGRKVETVTVLKHNDEMKTGIVIRGDDEVLGGPNYYLDNAYKDYMEYGDLEGIFRDLAREIETTWRCGLPIEMTSLDYENVKDNIIFCVVDKDKNKKKLADCPHSIDESGFALTYAIGIHNTGRIVINNELAESEGYNYEDLDKLAKSNMQKMYAPTLVSITDAVFALKEKDSTPENLLTSEVPSTDDMMYVLSNKDNFFGATALFYEGIKDQIADIFGMDFYAIPSSVHEWMIVPDRGGYDCSQFIDTLRTQNMLMDIQEVLSDDVYRYSRADNLLTKVDAA